MKYAVGDIHGCLDKLNDLIDRIQASDNNPEFVFIGDYGDRGPDSRGVVDRLIELNNNYKCTFIRGNHDDTICRILTGSSLFDLIYYVGRGSPSDVDKKTLSWWKHYGFKEFLASYGIKEDADIEEIRKAVPRNHVEFYQNTKLFHSEVVDGLDYIMVHAYYHSTYDMVPNGDLALAEIDPRSHQEKIYCTLWQKPSKEYVYSNNRVWKNTKVILGHTPTNHYNIDKSFDPIIGSNVIMIDTGSCFGGNLTAYCLETKSFIGSI